MQVNLNAPYELGEHKDLTITVYLPKGSGNHLGDKEKLELVACKILNEYYCKAIKKEHWQSDQLWFKPTKNLHKITDKRFVETFSTGIVTDNVTGREYDCGMRIDDDLLELLNELDNESKKIKLERNVYESFGDDVLKILRKYEINSLEKLDRILMEQRVW